MLLDQIPITIVACNVVQLHKIYHVPSILKPPIVRTLEMWSYMCRSYIPGGLKIQVEYYTKCTLRAHFVLK